MGKWLNSKAPEKANTSVIAQLNSSHKEKLPENRKYSDVITSMFNICSTTKLNS